MNLQILILIVTYIYLLQSTTNLVFGELCEKAHLLYDGSHRLWDINCEVTIIAGEKSGCVPILKCENSKDCTKGSLDISDGHGGREIICKDISVFPSGISDHLFIKTGETPPKCIISCGRTDYDLKGARPLAVTRHRNFTDKCVCGEKNWIHNTTKNEDDDYITPYEFPWLVTSIFVGPNRDLKKPACSLSIINDRTLLTAAHCWSGLVPPTIWNQYELWINVISIENFGINGRSRKLKIKQIIPHPLYNVVGYGSEFDIAIVQLSEKIDFISKNTINRPICLDTDNWQQDRVTQIGEIVSWEKYKSPITKYSMKKSNITITRSEVCTPKNRINEIISDKILCTKRFEFGDDCNRSNSGGALSIVSNHSVWKQIGIQAQKDCYNGWENYIRVNEFLTWIYHHSREGTWCFE